jgi:hypothetical protein
MSPERTIDIPPKPSALINSLRGLGYSPEAALADLIDNSITASASVVEIDLQWNGGTPIAAILDNGRGMDEFHLFEAMRLGGAGPTEHREDSDLGRFGMGLKTASLSQCRRVTIASKTDILCGAAALDVDIVAARGWVAVVPDPLPSHRFVQQLTQQESGTVVIWEHIDELSGLCDLKKEAFYLRLEEIRAYLGMVFHRFIDGDATRLKISINGRDIKAWNPFHAHAATIELPSERIRHSGYSFTVKPYVLPHRDRFANEAEYDAAGGPGGWGARQGFYVYRGKRLLVAGSWLGLGGARTWTRDEASRLARIQIDLPTGLDRDWRIDVRKSQARPPGALRDRLTNIARRCREEAREVFAFRGQGPRSRGAAQTAPAVWITSQGPLGALYRINRDHPIVTACREANIGNAKSLDAVFSIIERTVPVERIWLDISESEGAEIPTLTPEEASSLVEQLLELSKFLPKNMTLDQRLDALMLNLPGNSVSLREKLARRLGETA